jgi:hypothetical protein
MNHEHNEQVIKHRARTIVLQRTVIGLAAVIVIAILSLLVVDVINGMRARQAILDCTVSTGDCFKENQKRTGEVVGDIAQQGIDRELVTRHIIQLASFCADAPGHQSYQEIEQCILNRMTKEEKAGMTSDSP